MTLDIPALAGLDDVAWDSLEHAYGPAGDVPELLRTLAGGDAEQAEEAVYELYGTIWHQGSVYPATVPAVPFLAAIAASGAAGTQTPRVLRLLGDIAASRDPRGVEDPAAVRSAVAAQVEVVAGLLDDREAEARAAAQFVLVHAGERQRVRSLILEHWHGDAEALHAMMRVDAEKAADLADEVVSDDPLLTVSCALAWIRAGRPVDERVREAALTPIPADSELWCWNDEGELFDQVISALAERLGARAAVELLTEALDRIGDGPAESVDSYLSTARWLIVSYRSAPALLAEPLARLLAETVARPDLARRVVGLLELIGPPTARDRLVALAAADDALLAAADSLLADDALACLARWNDPAVPALLALALTDRPHTLNVIAASGIGIPFDTDLLAAIRQRLAEICDAENDPPAEPDNPFAAVRDRSEPGRLAGILTGWGDHAAPAVPELVRLLAIRPTVAAPALAAIHLLSLEGMAMLRRVAATAEEGDAVRARLAAAQAIRALTQDPAPLLAAVHFGLTTPTKNPDDRAVVAEAATELPDHADSLIPLLRQALRAIAVPTPSLPAHQARMKLGRALWQLTGDPDDAIDVLRATLALAGELFTAWTVATAADLAAELGPAARDLAPALEAALSEPASCPAATQALLAIDPDGPWSGPRREELADRLLATLDGTNSPITRGRALDALSALTALAPLPPSTAEKLRAFADQDERFPIGVHDIEQLRGDEEIRERIRALLQG
ncbi:hypothetical protein ABH926_003430 [Catenulispora sp. GP43]|uniref:hypothetical protein n=1 Tax=Catenulispora sp. GP43 TaxID=3156263 RepID=UPI0035181A00